MTVSSDKASVLKYLGVFFVGTVLILLPIAAQRRLPAGDSKEQIQVGGAAREYALHVPKDLPLGKKVPLLLVFHGGGGHAWRMSKFTGFDQVADENRFIVVYPEAVNKSWDDTRGLSKADDVGFIRALIDHLTKELPIDASRVYATGISNGGFFSNRLACDLSDRIAAIASVAATMPTTLPASCHPTRPISVMYLNGTKDPLVPIDGGPVGANLGFDRGECISLADAAAFWAKWDKTAPTPRASQIPDRVDDGTHIRKDIYTTGENDTEVVVYRIEDGGHTWPGGSQYLPKMIVGRVTHQIDGSREIWKFLEKQSLTGANPR